VVGLLPASIYDILVIAGERTTVNVTLEEGGIISARVVCQAGDPVVGAWVNISGPPTQWDHGWVLTDQDGYYNFTGLASGTYEMRVTSPEGAGLLPATIYEIVVTAGETTIVDVTLDREV